MKGLTNNPNGRPKGSLNKRTKTLIEMAEAANCDPLTFLFHVSNGNSEALGLVERDEDGNVRTMPIPMEIRIKVSLELLPYLHAKRKALEPEPDTNGSNELVLKYSLDDDGGDE